MRLIDEHTAPEYLRETRRIAAREAVRVRELTGGVSNMVLLVERPDEPGGYFVLKQAREQLRTRQAWFSSPERIWREAAVLAICARLLERKGRQESNERIATTPQILFEDRENFLFAMTAAPTPHTVWKAELLAGRADGRIAAACGALLATLHGESWLDADVAAAIGDVTWFDQLRVDPYYRALAASHPEAADTIQRLIDSLACHPRSLVHADFSPKNLLVSPAGLMMVDFETGHYGDPAFDIGFFLSHLVLKACYHQGDHARYLSLADQFWEAYATELTPQIGPTEFAQLAERGMMNLAGCAWARLDGKSPVEYLTDPRKRDLMRTACRDMLATPPADWPRAALLLHTAFDSH